MSRDPSLPTVAAPILVSSDVLSHGCATYFVAVKPFGLILEQENPRVEVACTSKEPGYGLRMYMLVPVYCLSRLKRNAVSPDVLTS